VPAGRALLEALWHPLSTLTPYFLAYAVGEAAVIAAIIVISRSCRRRSVQAPFVSLL